MYRSGSRDYLKRAKQLLGTGDYASLFHAAFELRCGIEARMREYLEVAEDVSEKKKQGWRIAILGNELEKIFQLGDKIVQLTFHRAEGQKGSIYHTPVRSQLRQQAERLGDYLHAMKIYRKPDDSWWKFFKSFLNETSNGLEFATKGTLLGPPLLRPDTKLFQIHHELKVDLVADELMLSMGSLRGNIKMGVNYLDALPINAT